MKSFLKNEVGSILNSYEADRSNFEIVDFCQKWIHRQGKVFIDYCVKDFFTNVKKPKKFYRALLPDK